MPNCRKRFVWALCLLPLALPAQTQPEMAAVLQRLDRLERENRDLAREVAELKAQIANRPVAAGAPRDGSPAPEGTALQAHGSSSVNPPRQEAAAPLSVEERLDIDERRIEEQAQTKVEASQKFPIRLSGMLLFNSFLDSHGNGGFDYPTVASPANERAGATLRQSIVGLEFRGPKTFFGGSVHGSVYMDFFTGTPPLGQTFRLRTGSIEVDWKRTRVLVGQEKPIFNPREPSSLAQVGISPLTGAGNLWLWIPQVRVEHDIAFSASTGLRARMGVIETREVPPYDNTPINGTLAPARPGLEGRYEFFHNFDDNRHIEIAPGFHASTTHAGGISIPSDLWSLDWSIVPWRRVEVTGVFYSGENVSNLGTGLINQGYTLYRRSGRAIPSKGGWGQLTIHANSRTDLHFFSGQQDDRNSYLGSGDIGKNLVFGANLFFRIAPNVILAPEISQLRTAYLVRGTVINNHYDLALAYLF